MNQAVEMIKAGDRLLIHYGMTVETAEDGLAVVALTVRDHMLNALGMTHGAVVHALADVAFALACNAGGKPTVAMHGAINYLRPTRLGDRLVARAVETAMNGRTGIYDVTISDGDGTVVATFRGTARRLNGR